MYSLRSLLRMIRSLDASDPRGPRRSGSSLAWRRRRTERFLKDFLKIFLKAPFFQDDVRQFVVRREVKEGKKSKAWLKRKEKLEKHLRLQRFSVSSLHNSFSASATSRTS